MDPEAEVISQVLLDRMVLPAKDRQAEAGSLGGSSEHLGGSSGHLGASSGHLGGSSGQLGGSSKGSNMGKHERRWQIGEGAPRVLPQVPGGWQLPGPLRLPQWGCLPQRTTALQAQRLDFLQYHQDHTQGQS